MGRNRQAASRIDLVSLRLLVAAIEEGNLARAAERENIAVSSVSRRISDLEQRLGVQLLHRHDRGVKPTAAASAILAKSHQVFGLLDEIIEDLADVGSGVRGLLRVWANMTAVAGDLASYVAQFSASHPEVVTELEEATSLEIVHAIRADRCDVGIISGTVEANGLHLIPWIEDELAVVLPPGHALAARTSLPFEDLLDQPFIGLQHDSALQLLYREKAAGLGRQLDERAHVSSFDAARKLVSAGCGIAILPRFAIEPEGAVAVRPLQEPWARREMQLCTRSPQLPALVAMFVEFVRGQTGPAPG